MSDLWDNLGRDVTAERRDRSVAEGRAAVQHLWPWLSASQDIPEFDQRLALVKEPIEAKVPESARGEVIAGLRADFVLLKRGEDSRPHTPREKGRWDAGLGVPMSAEEMSSKDRAEYEAAYVERKKEKESAKLAGDHKPGDEVFARTKVYDVDSTVDAVYVREENGKAIVKHKNSGEEFEVAPEDVAKKNAAIWDDLEEPARSRSEDEFNRSLCKNCGHTHADHADGGRCGYHGCGCRQWVKKEAGKVAEEWNWDQNEVELWLANDHASYQQIKDLQGEATGDDIRRIFNGTYWAPVDQDNVDWDELAQSWNDEWDEGYEASRRTAFRQAESLPPRSIGTCASCDEPIAKALWTWNHRTAEAEIACADHRGDDPIVPKQAAERGSTDDLLEYLAPNEDKDLARRTIDDLTDSQRGALQDDCEMMGDSANLTIEDITEYRMEASKTAAAHAPWQGGARAYPEVDKFSEAVEAFKRKRRGFLFIARDPEGTPCAVCGEPVTDKSNRCEYSPQTKTATCMHYDCSWGKILQEVVEADSFSFGATDKTMALMNTASNLIEQAVQDGGGEGGQARKLIGTKVEAGGMEGVICSVAKTKGAVPIGYGFGITINSAKVAGQDEAKGEPTYGTGLPPMASAKTSEMFPGPGAQVYRNEAGEPLGWDYPSEPDPYDDFDDDFGGGAESAWMEGAYEAAQDVASEAGLENVDGDRFAEWWLSENRNRARRGVDVWPTVDQARDWSFTYKSSKQAVDNPFAGRGPETCVRCGKEFPGGGYCTGTEENPHPEVKIFAHNASKVAAQPFDIVGYTYKAANYCPDCTATVIADPDGLHPMMEVKDAEGVLDAWAQREGIDRQDEYSFDSDDFPKVIFRDQIEEDEHCEGCGRTLGDLEGGDRVGAKHTARDYCTACGEDIVLKDGSWCHKGGGFAEVDGHVMSGEELDRDHSVAAMSDAYDKGKISNIYDDWDKALEYVRSAKTIDDLYSVMGPPSSGDAFWMGDGDELLGALMDAGWSTVEVQAPYLWAMRTPDGKEILTYVEGDLYRGDKSSLIATKCKVKMRTAAAGDFDLNIRATGDDLAICERLFEASTMGELPMRAGAFTIGDVIELDGRAYRCGELGFTALTDEDGKNPFMMDENPFMMKDPMDQEGLAPPQTMTGTEPQVPDRDKDSGAQSLGARVKRRVRRAFRREAGPFNPGVDTPGYQALWGNFAPDYDDNNDPWGHVMSWYFGVAEVLQLLEPNMIPSEWEFSPGMGGGGVPEEHPDSLIYEMTETNDVTPDDLVEFGNYLKGERDRLEAEGKAY